MILWSLFTTVFSVRLANLFLSKLTIPLGIREKGGKNYVLISFPIIMVLYFKI